MATRITEDYVWSSRDEPRPPNAWVLNVIRQLLPKVGEQWSRNRLMAALSVLHNTLSQQFEIEERGGYLAEVLACSPNWSVEVGELGNQHPALLAELQGLQQRAEGLPDGAEADQELRNDIDRWVRSLSAHEHHEARLMQAALYLEIGDMD